jgi:hypothetical protein
MLSGKVNVVIQGPQGSVDLGIFFSPLNYDVIVEALVAKGWASVYVQRSESATDFSYLIQGSTRRGAARLRSWKKRNFTRKSRIENRQA